MSSKEIVAPDALNASLVLDVLTGKVPATSVVFSEPDREETARRIAEQDANAQSKEELLGKNAISGKNFVNKPFELRSGEWQRGEDQYAEGGVGFYAVLHGADQKGSTVTITCGASTVMRKAAVLAQKGWLPAWVKITQGKPNDAGFFPLGLDDATEFAPFGK